MPEAAAPHGITLAFDFGAARTGVAQGEAALAIAHPLTTIHTTSREERLTRIAALVKEWQPRQLVVGLPCHADGNAHDMTARARNFARALSRRFRVPVYLVDERYTSVAAEHLLTQAEVYGRRRKEAMDQVAAQAILSRFFEGEFELLPAQERD